MKKRKIIRLTALFLLLIFTIWMLRGNLTVGMTVYDITDENLPEGFEGYRIAQISDLHNYEYGDGNSVLIDILKKGNPDVIFITGDIVDQRVTDINISADFVKQAAEIAPCYYVTGNHEFFIDDDFEILRNELEKAGALILRNDSAVLCSGGDSVQLIGVDDPIFLQRKEMGKYTPSEAMAVQLDNIENNGDYRILLSHRPELFDVYVDHVINLVFAGHAHGGQVRLPFIGGLYAPHQGKFPEYDCGIYHEIDTTMILSRGIGNSVVTVRFNNRPEIVLAILHKK